jgi:hypothetical protein
MSDWRDRPCDEWEGYCDHGGYGQATMPVNGEPKTHRIEWIKNFGPPPPDKPEVLHHCDNPPCREITHLFVGTQADNMADKKAKGRHHNTVKRCCPRCDGEYTTNSEGKRRCLSCENKRKNNRRKVIGR